MQMKRLLASFKSASTKLCDTLASVARRLSTCFIDPCGLSAFVACRLIALDNSKRGSYLSFIAEEKTHVAKYGSYNGIHDVKHFSKVFCICLTVTPLLTTITANWIRRVTIFVLTVLPQYWQSIKYYPYRRGNVSHKTRQSMIQHPCVHSQRS